MFKRLFLAALLVLSVHAEAAIVGNPVPALQSGAAASSLVLSTTTANLYSAQVAIGSSAGYAMLFNSATAPADGAVTPVLCVYVPANTTANLSFPNPVPFSTGITIVSSSTGCFTKTAANANFLSAQVR